MPAIIILTFCDEDIKSLYERLEGVDFDDLPVGQLRLEQGLLRKYLIEQNSLASKNGSKCQICNKYFPKNLLIAETWDVVIGRSTI